MDIVRTVALQRSYRLGKVLVPALNGVDLTVGEGEFLAIMGPSGCGKSTLMHLLGGLDRPTSGQVLIDGIDLAGLTDRARTRLRGERIAFVFQRFNLFPTLTAQANLELAAEIKGIRATADTLIKLLDLVGLGHKKRATPLEMSIGEQQRTAIARSLVGEPRLLLTDEPTGSLDSDNSRRVLQLFRDVHKNLKQTMIMITHSEEAASYADRVIHMKDGRVVA